MPTTKEIEGEYKVLRGGDVSVWHIGRDLKTFKSVQLAGISLWTCDMSHCSQRTIVALIFGHVAAQ